MIRIGLDFDNTIVRYDEVFAAAAAERGFLPESFPGNKQAVRDAILLRPDGELDWQRLQGHVYGKGIGRAQAFAGVDSFLRRAHAANAHVMIVSHKTDYGHFDPDRVNLRAAAIAWMEARGFFAVNGAVLRREDIHFAATRTEKLSRIRTLRCDVFVDDLPEVLCDPDFPVGIIGILFSEHAEQGGETYRVCRSWNEIEQAIFR